MGDIENSTKGFSDFMLSEYDHISEAHFETAKQIASFFRYYLLIVSAPYLVVLFFEKEQPKMLEQLLVNPTISDINWLIFSVFLVISIIGYFINIFIIGLEFDRILYARTVNGIRKYFLSKTSEQVTDFLVLPINVGEPHYFQKRFLAIVLSFALINSVFTYTSMLVIRHEKFGLIASLIFFVIHLVTYAALALSRKK